MRPSVSALVVAALAALGYLTAVAVTGSVVTAVRAAVDQWRTAGEVTGPVIAQAIGRTAPTASLWAWIAVDAAVVVLCWRAWGVGTGGVAAVDRPLLLWVVTLTAGVQIAYFALTRLLDTQAGWLLLAAPARSGGVDSLTASPTALVLAVVLHPVAVELLFRGVITDRLASAGLSAAVTVASTALLFAIVQPTVPLAVLGGVFGAAAGVLRWRTGSAAVAVTAHYALVAAGAVAWAGVGRAATTTPALVTAAAAGLVLAASGLLLADRRAARRPGDTP